jgi:hypothetical protein
MQPSWTGILCIITSFSQIKKRPQQDKDGTARGATPELLGLLTANQRLFLLIALGIKSEDQRSWRSGLCLRWLHLEPHKIVPAYNNKNSMVLAQKQT